MPTNEPQLAQLARLLDEEGFTLEEMQPHIGGERTLMSAQKWVLVGRDRAGGRVILKASDTSAGIAEITQEREVRKALLGMSFAQDQLLMPEERYWGTLGPYTVFATDFIEQPRVFVAHSIEEQFFLALRAFEVQEAFHATTYGHRKEVASTFPWRNSDAYLKDAEQFARTVAKSGSARAEAALTKTSAWLAANRTTLARYEGYLTHTDFVPHNLRIADGAVYLLDHSAILFGNKYEGWARFINYMALHNPTLERLLMEHVARNRSADEYLCLRLMRAYKLGFLLSYYAQAIAKTEGSLQTLSKIRLEFWSAVLEHVLADTPVPEKLVETYVQERDALRTEEEKKRQREFALA